MPPLPHAQITVAWSITATENSGREFSGYRYGDRVRTCREVSRRGLWVRALGLIQSAQTRHYGLQPQAAVDQAA